MTIVCKHDIGDPLWHAAGVYSIPLQKLIYSIKFEYNDLGVKEVFYRFEKESTVWYSESVVFNTLSELQHYLNLHQ